MKKHGITALKAAFAAAVIAYLVHRGIITLAPLQRLADWPGAAALTILLIYLTLPLGAWRWYLLLRSQGIWPRWRAVYHITAIGNFAGVFMPGAAGGDAIRLLYILAEAGKGRRTAATLSVAIDRITGLLGLIAVAIVALGTHLLGRVEQGDLTRLLPILLVAFVGTVAVGAGGVALCARLVALPMVRGKAEAGGPVGAAVKLITALAAYRGHERVLLTVLLLAVGTHLFTVAALVVVAMVMSTSGLGIADFAVATPIGLVANVVPLTPGGIGLGEGAFAKICALLDPAQATGYGTIFLAYRALTSLALLAGGASWLAYKRPIAAPLEEAA